MTGRGLVSKLYCTPKIGHAVLFLSKQPGRSLAAPASGSQTPSGFGIPARSGCACAYTHPPGTARFGNTPHSSLGILIGPPSLLWTTFLRPLVHTLRTVEHAAVLIGVALLLWKAVGQAVAQATPASACPANSRAHACLCSAWASRL
jgi:hypothetical protein